MARGDGDGLWRRDCKLVRIKVMNINHTVGSFPRSFPDEASHGLARTLPTITHRTIICILFLLSHSRAHLPPPFLELRAFAHQPGVEQLAVSKYRPIIHFSLPSFPPSQSSCLSGTHPAIAPSSTTFPLLPSLPVETVYGRTCERFDADPLDMATACQVIRT